jgi:acetyltransferase-like isoleucine patch superfamily enzyme
VLVPVGACLALGEGAYVGRQVELGPGPLIEIGARSSVQDRCVLLGDVRIGRYCTIAYGVYASSGKHRFDADPARLIKDQDLSAPAAPGPVVIEDDCWIGNGVFIAAGVTVGKGAVVGANAVVTADVPPYAVVAGVPARALRQRLDFRPPREIRHDRREDLPYFYSGFRLADDERLADGALGGIVAPGNFTLALQGSGRLRIRARALLDSRQALEHAGTAHPLAREFTEIEYRLAAGWRVALASSGPVCVARAWIE